MLRNLLAVYLFEYCSYSELKIKPKTWTIIHLNGLNNLRTKFITYLIKMYALLPHGHLANRSTKSGPTVQQFWKSGKTPQTLTQTFPFSS